MRGEALDQGRRAPRSDLIHSYNSRWRRCSKPPPISRAHFTQLWGLPHWLGSAALISGRHAGQMGGKGRILLPRHCPTHWRHGKGRRPLSCRSRFDLVFKLVRPGSSNHRWPLLRIREKAARGRTSNPVSTSLQDLRVNGAGYHCGTGFNSWFGGTCDRFRRLWQSVVLVGKGDHLDGPQPGGEVSVEELVRAVQALSPGASAVSAVSRGLYFLDSGALAALLKELHKSGYGRQACEIFDWLRGLEPEHALARLADVYTYTTSIAQCGSHQQLRRALALV
jgi:hypothetical protein